MKSIVRKIILWGICAVYILTCSYATAESTQTHFLLSGEMSSPFCIRISSPVFQQLSQFGTDRLNSLNRLISHLSVSVLADDEQAEAVLSVDDEQLFSIIQTNDNTAHTIKTSSPNTVYHKQDRDDQGESEENEVKIFLDKQFFRINHLLDEFYPVFARTAEAFPELTGKSSANLNFSGFGKSEGRLTIQFSADYVQDHFPAALADLCETETGKNFLKNLVFQGSQKIVLLYDKDNQLLRINYDGTLGTSSEDLRRVSLVWKCLRSENHIKDSLTIKTPAVSGYDRDNLAYERDQNESDPVKHVLKWDYQLDQKRGKEKTKIRYTCDQSETETDISSKIVYNRKGDHPEHSVYVTAALEKEKDDEYSGTLEITDKTGKIITSRVSAGLHIGSSEGVFSAQPDNMYSQPTEENDKNMDSEEIPADIVRILIRRFMSMPDEDVEFLRRDIPEETWEMLKNY